MDITIETTWDEQPCVMRLYVPSGTGGTSWNVMKDNYYCGTLNYRGDEWQCFLHPGAGFVLSDVQIMAELIMMSDTETYEGEPFPPHIAFVNW